MLRSVKRGKVQFLFTPPLIILDSNIVEQILRGLKNSRYGRIKYLKNEWSAGRYSPYDMAKLVKRDLEEEEVLSLWSQTWESLKKSKKIKSCMGLFSMINKAN